jgi:hypothetical protein
MGCVRYPDAHIEDYRLSINPYLMGQCVGLRAPRFIIYVRLSAGNLQYGQPISAYLIYANLPSVNATRLHQ